jgi:hypothetical protein
MYMKKPSTQKTTIRDFHRFSSDLLMRGFVEEPEKVEQGVMHDKMRVASFKREFSDFMLRIGASQEAADIMAASERGLGREDMGASLWAKCATYSNSSVGEFVRMFSHKSHYVESGGRDTMVYHADLVPFPDASVLIDSCLKLGSAVAKIKNDVEFSAAIDAKEVEEKIGEAQKRVRADNSLAAYLGNYLRPMFESFRKKIDYEFARVLHDPDVLQALNQVADKE